jgi:hypothetical protein
MTSLITAALYWTFVSVPDLGLMTDEYRTQAKCWLSLSLSLSLWLYSPLDPGGVFSYLILYTIRRTLWTGDQPVARPLPTHRITQIHNKRTQTSMPRLGFETTISVFERAKMVHALDCAATVIGWWLGFENRNTQCIKEPHCRFVQ